MIRVNGHTITPQFFPDGTFNLTDLGGCFADMQDNKIHRSANFYCVEWRWDNAAEYMLLYFITNHIKNQCGAALMHLYLPYIPDARMDRVKEPYNEVFTLKYFAQFINSLGYDKVIVLDPHSNVAAALIDRIEIIWPTDFVRRVVEENNIEVLCFPDEGAMKRYSDGCNFRPYVYGEKKRDWKTGKIEKVIMQNPIGIDLKDKHVLIVDDICSKGGTFFYAGKALQELGVGQIDLFVSHCEDTIYSGNLFSPISPITTIYSTDSLATTEREGIHTLKIWEDK